MLDKRLQQLTLWCQQSLPEMNIQLVPLAADASFRRYYRVIAADKTWVAMDAPPDKEPCEPFVAIAHAFEQMGVNVPHVYAQDIARGFLLLTDLGDELYLANLTQANADMLYQTAFEPLLKIHGCAQIQNHRLPDFTETLLMTELENFRYWFLQQYLSLNLSNEEQLLLDKTFQQLYDNARAQPQVCLHRDYHSRNLMLLPTNQVGVIDFQDAVLGPVTYDIVSLLRDCYIHWPVSQVEAWLQHFYQMLRMQRVIDQTPWQEFLRWFDLMGMQRHLKASFIFARKLLRDGNANYIQDIPRTLNYVAYVCAKYSELADFSRWFEDVILPRFQQVLAA